jgi:hypothetical protein
MSISGLAGLLHTPPQQQLVTPSVSAKVDSDGDHDNNAPDSKPAAAPSSGRPLNLVA